jgi:hypothetical protein
MSAIAWVACSTEIEGVPPIGVAITRRPETDPQS